MITLSPLFNPRQDSAVREDRLAVGSINAKPAVDQMSSEFILGVLIGVLPVEVSCPNKCTFLASSLISERISLKYNLQSEEDYTMHLAFEYQFWHRRFGQHGTDDDSTALAMR